MIKSLKWLLRSDGKVDMTIAWNDETETIICANSNMYTVMESCHAFIVDKKLPIAMNMASVLYLVYSKLNRRSERTLKAFAPSTVDKNCLVREYNILFDTGNNV